MAQGRQFDASFRNSIDEQWHPATPTEAATPSSDDEEPREAERVRDSSGKLGPQPSCMPHVVLAHRAASTLGSKASGHQHLRAFPRPSTSQQTTVPAPPPPPKPTPLPPELQAASKSAPAHPPRLIAQGNVQPSQQPSQQLHFPKPPPPPSRATREPDKKTELAFGENEEDDALITEAMADSVAEANSQVRASGPVGGRHAGSQLPLSSEPLARKDSVTKLFPTARLAEAAGRRPAMRSRTSEQLGEVMPTEQASPTEMPCGAPTEDTSPTEFPFGAPTGAASPTELPSPARGGRRAAHRQSAYGRKRPSSLKSALDAPTELPSPTIEPRGRAFVSRRPSSARKRDAEFEAALDAPTELPSPDGLAATRVGVPRSRVAALRASGHRQSAFRRRQERFGHVVPTEVASPTELPFGAPTETASPAELPFGVAPTEVASPTEMPARAGKSRGSLMRPPAPRTKRVVEPLSLPPAPTEPLSPSEPPSPVLDPKRQESPHARVCTVFSEPLSIAAVPTEIPSPTEPLCARRDVLPTEVASPTAPPSPPPPRSVRAEKVRQSGSRHARTGKKSGGSNSHWSRQIRYVYQEPLGVAAATEAASPTELPSPAGLAASRIPGNEELFGAAEPTEQASPAELSPSPQLRQLTDLVGDMASTPKAAAVARRLERDDPSSHVEPLSPGNVRDEPLGVAAPTEAASPTDMPSPVADDHPSRTEVVRKPVVMPPPPPPPPKRTGTSLRFDTDVGRAAPAAQAFPSESKHDEEDFRPPPPPPKRTCASLRFDTDVGRAAPAAQASPSELKHDEEDFRPPPPPPKRTGTSLRFDTDVGRAALAAQASPSELKQDEEDFRIRQLGDAGPTSKAAPSRPRPSACKKSTIDRTAPSTSERTPVADVPNIYHPQGHNPSVPASSSPTCTIKHGFEFAARSAGIAEHASPSSSVSLAQPKTDRENKEELGAFVPTEAASPTEMHSPCADVAEAEAVPSQEPSFVECEHADDPEALAAIANLVRQAKELSQVAARVGLQRNIFDALDSEKEGLLNCKKMRRFAELMGFDGDDEAWADEFEALLQSHGDPSQGGFTHIAFQALIDDESDDGFFCTMEELSAAAGKLYPQEPAEERDLRENYGGEPADDDEVPQTEMEGDSDSDCSRAESAGEAEQLEVLAAGWEAPSGEESEDEDELARPGRAASSVFADSGNALMLGTPAEMADMLTKETEAGTEGYPVMPPAFADQGRSTSPPLKRNGRNQAVLASSAFDTSRPSTGSAQSPRGVATTESLTRLRQELASLQTPMSMKDRQSVPKLAKRIARKHLPVAGAPAVFSVMASAFGAPGLDPRHRLVVAYVFHDLLANQVAREEKSAIVRDGASHFLEPIKDVVATVHPSKKEPFLKLIGVWSKSKFFSDGYLRRMRSSWTSPVPRPPPPRSHPVRSRARPHAEQTTEPQHGTRVPASVPPAPRPPTASASNASRRAALRRPRPDSAIDASFVDPAPTSPPCPPPSKRRKHESKGHHSQRLTDPAPTTPPCAPVRKSAMKGCGQGHGRSSLAAQAAAGGFADVAPRRKRQHVELHQETSPIGRSPEPSPSP